MKSLLCLFFTGLAGTCAVLSLSCSERSADVPAPAAPPSAPAPAPAPSSSSGSAVAVALAGKLVKLVNGAAVAASIQGDPEYFVFYHSASW